jgi:hypothetical protein
MDDMKPTWGFYEGAIMWLRVQNPKVIGSFILTIYLRAIKKRSWSKNHDKSNKLKIPLKILKSLFF